MMQIRWTGREIGESSSGVLSGTFDEKKRGLVYTVLKSNRPFIALNSIAASEKQWVYSK